MKTIPNNRAGRASIILVVFMAFFALAFAAVIGLLSFFLLGSDARALRNGFLAGTDCSYRQRVAVNVGGATAGLVRYGARFFKAPPEALAGIEAFRGADVGVYRLGAGRRPDAETAFASMDQRMRDRGWDRVVGVTQDRQLVAVYLSRKTVSVDRVHCCFLVLQGDDLIVGSAKASLRSIMELPQVQEGLNEAFAQMRSVGEHL